MYKILAKTLFIGKNVVFLPECHSTNIHASTLADDHAIDGTIVITENQTAGKGQRGNTWTSEPGKNLTFSIILQPSFLSVRDQFYLNRAVSLGVYDYVRKTIDFPVHIKWPNDLLVAGKKVCGILIENSVAGVKINYSIVGIGLNMNQRSLQFDRASSLGLLANREFDLGVEFEELVANIESRYLLLKGGNYELIRHDYYECLFWRGETRIFKSGNEIFEGRIEADNDEGRLLIHTTDGVRTFGVKEVEYIK